MEIEDSNDEPIDRILFKIDLIVWKCCTSSKLCTIRLKFKIDLIVWKSLLIMTTPNHHTMSLK